MITYRQLAAEELTRLGEIDRTESIDTLYVQHGTELEAVSGDFSASPWHGGHGEHSLEHEIEVCEFYRAAGGTVLGAFAGERLVGIGIVVPSVRPGIAQLAYLHVSNGLRGQGIGVYLTEEMERLARAAGARWMVISATPSENTVRFYRGRGYEPTATPLPELYEREPEDVHLEKRL